MNQASESPAAPLSDPRCPPEVAQALSREEWRYHGASLGWASKVGILFFLRWEDALVALVGDLRRSRDFTRDWYSVRIQHLDDWVRKHRDMIGEETASEFFCIIANGTPSLSAPPTYAQSLNAALNRASVAEDEVEKLRAEIARLQSVRPS